MDPIEGAPSDNTTIVGVLAQFREDGYGADFMVESGPALRCRECDHVIPVEELELDALRRIEGASDPDDMAAVLAVRCPSCGTKGTALVAYGPTASEDEDELLRQLPDADRDGGTRAQFDD